MKLFSKQVRTCHFPYTHTLLQRLLPGIYEHQCFNEAELPFAQEVYNTEIGHLFEHVLLEYLCQIKGQQCQKEIVFKGNTQWDWYKEPIGTFNIVINVGSKDFDIFTQALIETTNLLATIFQPQDTLKSKEAAFLPPLY